MLKMQKVVRIVMGIAGGGLLFVGGNCNIDNFFVDGAVTLRDAAIGEAVVAGFAPILAALGL